jgi:malate synthase
LWPIAYAVRNISVLGLEKIQKGERVSGVRVNANVEGAETILTDEAIKFLSELHSKFGGRRQGLLANRIERQKLFNKEGFRFDFLPETQAVRKSDWKVGPTPKALQDRRTEITGPAEPKMMINALNSGAKAFMVDIEDALSPSWKNIIAAQVALKAAFRHELEYTNEAGKKYQLNQKIAQMLVRPRGWHLEEKNFSVDGEAISASLFDFGLCFFHNAKEQLMRGNGPFFYLPKLESHLEASLWDEVFVFAQEYVGIPQGSIKTTVLIETLPAAFEMEEILYELKDHIVGLNAGRWDYIFSAIKCFHAHPSKTFPDRDSVGMTVPFIDAYARKLVQVCHKRGAHAIGGMAAFIPQKNNEELNKVAFSKVEADKSREASQGFDGTWVAHPGLVAVAMEQFDKAFGDAPNQKSKLLEETVTTSDLQNFEIEGGKVTEEGVRKNIRVALHYMTFWLNGIGAAAIESLMEDAATAEISRAQLWQWLHHSVAMAEGKVLSKDLFKQFMQEETEKLKPVCNEKLSVAVELLDNLVMSENFESFLTPKAYRFL